MGRENIVLIAMQVLQSASDFGDVEDAEDRFRVICSHLEKVWVTGDWEERYKAAVATLIMSYSEGYPQRERVEAQVRAYNALGAMFQGVGAGVEALIVAGHELEALGGGIDLCGVYESFAGKRE